MVRTVFVRLAGVRWRGRNLDWLGSNRSPVEDAIEP